MKAKIISLIAGAALAAANIGFTQAADLNQIAGVPDILNGVAATHEATLMTPTEMDAVRGQKLLLKLKGSGWKVTVRQLGKRKKMRTRGNVPQWAKDKAWTYM